MPYIKSVDEVAQKLIMHRAEVEEVIHEGERFKDMVYGKITSIEDHPDADSLKVCMVDIGLDRDVQIVCGGSNLYKGQIVAVAKPGSKVIWHGEGEPVVLTNTKIRGVESFGMIRASEEIYLSDIYPSSSNREILDFGTTDIAPGTPLATGLGFDDSIFDIDNKAINHRPDMFSYMGVMRDISSIYGRELDVEYIHRDFSTLDKLNLTNEIPDVVRRYTLTKIEGVGNIDSPDYIKTIVKASGHEPKGLLVDVTNYSLYFYGQPTHIFDADKVEGDIVVRYAKFGENIKALDGKIYTLETTDIVIADSKKVLAIGGIMGGEYSAVSDTTKNIIIESGNFDQAVVRKTSKRLGLRSDSSNVFEKDPTPRLASYGASLVISELENHFQDLKLISYIDDDHTSTASITLPFNLEFYNNLIGAKYTSIGALKILNNLGIKFKDDILYVPFWRTDISRDADIAEEIARIDGYDNVEMTIPRINLGAIHQDAIYDIKNISKDYWTNIGFYEVYNYSFVNKELMMDLNMSVDNLISLKNYLSLDQTHMRDSLIPNLMLGLKDNIRSKKNLKLFELEKVFHKDNSNVSEDYYLSGVIVSDKDIVYYDIQEMLSIFLEQIGIDKYEYSTSKTTPAYAHKNRTGSLKIRGTEVGYIGEIHPIIASRFDVKNRIGFFEINISKIAPSSFNLVKSHSISEFQENTFDISVLIPKNIAGSTLKKTIYNANKTYIKNVDLIDIYENSEKLGDNRSITFKVYIQSMEGTIDDKKTSEIIKEITQKLVSKGRTIR